MELRTKLKEYAAAKGWHFVYGRKDYQNLQQAVEWIQDELQAYGIGETVLFCDPIARRPEADGKRYTGNFMVLTRSDIDQSYDEKFEKYIEPLFTEVDEKMKTNLECIYDIDGWQSIEVINMFDFNADGLNIQFNLKFL